MSAQQAYRKINRDEVYEYIKSLIESSPNKEIEISATDLADKFGVQAPTMDYHLNKLLEDGLLELSSKRGRYNRKIYYLPSIKKEADPQELIFNDPEAFKELLLKKMEEQKSENKEEQKIEAEEQPFEAEEQEAPEFINEKAHTSVNNIHTSEIEKPRENIEKAERVEPIEVKDLTLDKRIERFIQQSKSVTPAEQLLTKEDREILSVINESLQQQMVFFKDLTEQLSTREDKRLVQMLIDERNAMKEQMDRMKEEMSLLIEQTKEAQSKNASIDPNRVRQMHQIIINTLDTYLEQPNHALALGRKEFRKNMTKEISDLAKYVLNLVD